MPRVIHFEINAERPDRVMEFYEKTFGWKFKKWKGSKDYWLIKTGKDTEPGIDGGLARKENRPVRAQTTIEVFYLDEYLEKIRENGGRVIVPKTTILGIGYIAYFKDPEGNILGVMEQDSSAQEDEEYVEYEESSE